MKKSKFVDYNVLLAVRSHRSINQAETGNEQLLKGLSVGNLSPNQIQDSVVPSVTPQNLPTRRLVA
jgi:hypothetical protein